MSTVDPSKFNSVQRKVAWQSDTNDTETQPVGSPHRSNESEDEAEECPKDSFQAPIFDKEDSGSDYDTDLETEPPGKYRYRIALFASLLITPL